MAGTRSFVVASTALSSRRTFNRSTLPSFNPVRCMSSVRSIPEQVLHHLTAQPVTIGTSVAVWDSSASVCPCSSHHLGWTAAGVPGQGECWLLPGPQVVAASWAAGFFLKIIYTVFQEPSLSL